MANAAALGAARRAWYVRGMPASETKPPLTEAERLALAQKAFEEFKAMCFWSWRPDVQITTEILPQFLKDLRTHGGHKGWKLAAEIYG